MDEAIARDIARRSHDDQSTRHGSPMSEHVERVAAAVADDARAVALLHDVLEKTGTRLDDLHERGLTPIGRSALELLTRREGETFGATPSGSAPRTDRRERSPAASSSPISKTTSRSRTAGATTRLTTGRANMCSPRNTGDRRHRAHPPDLWPPLKASRRWAWKARQTTSYRACASRKVSKPSAPGSP